MHVFFFFNLEYRIFKEKINIKIGENLSMDVAQKYRLYLIHVAVQDSFPGTINSSFWTLNFTFLFPSLFSSQPQKEGNRKTLLRKFWRKKKDKNPKLVRKVTVSVRTFSQSCKKKQIQFFVDFAFAFWLRFSTRLCLIFCKNSTLLCDQPK